MHESSRLPRGWKPWLAISISGYVFLLLCTRPYSYVDSFNYALHIVNHYSGVYQPAHDPFWDFGHALWRPLGGVVWRIFEPTLDAAFPTDRALGAGVALIALSLLGGLVSLVFSFLVSAHATGKAWVAAAVSLGLVATDAVVNYSATGTAYMFGGCFQFAGLYVLLRGMQERPMTTWRGALAGALLGASVVIWFPFCLSIPGLICWTFLWPEPVARRERIRCLIMVAVGCVSVIVLSYAAVMASARITTVAVARDWMARNRYGIEPNRGYLRMLAGIPRSFLYLGQDAVAWKRVAFGGGGMHSRFAALASSGIWKAAVVYLVLGWLILRLRRSNYGRRLLISLCVTAVPILYFAAFLFDPGPPERYYAIFPLMFLAFAIILADDHGGWLDRAVPLVFFALMLIVNGSAMWRFDANRGSEDTIARLEAVNARATANDRILAVSFSDPLNVFTSARPFDSASRFRYRLYVVIESNTKQSLVWQQNLAAVAMDSWNRSGHVWVTLRLLANSPGPDWGWVEGDDQKVSWSEIPAFFHRLDFLPSFGGPDGFAELAPSDKNRALLSQLIPSGSSR